MAIFSSKDYFDSYLTYTETTGGVLTPLGSTSPDVVPLGATEYTTASATDSILDDSKDSWKNSSTSPDFTYRGLLDGKYPVFALDTTYHVHYKSADVPSDLIAKSLSDIAAGTVQLDILPPAVIAFSSTTLDGTYKTGDTVNITATMSEAVTGSFNVILDTGETITLAVPVGAPSNTLTGIYTVKAGQSSSDLAVTGFTIGSIVDVANLNMASTSVPTGANSIIDTKAIVINTSNSSSTTTVPSKDPESDPEPKPQEVKKTIDGVLLKQIVTTDKGINIISSSVETITKERVEDPTTAHKTHADMPIGLVDKGAGIHIAMPINTAFSSEGLEAPQSSLDLKNNLIKDINPLFNKTHESAVTNFLSSFEQAPTFFEQKITLTSSDAKPASEAIIIDGTHNPNPEKVSIINALVIDAEKLPEKSEVQIEQVSFIALKGNINLKTGNVGNTVVIDDATTKKILFTQGGDDFIHTGKGEYVLHGGLKSDTVHIDGKASDYKIVQDYAKVTVSSLTDSKDILELVNIEKLQFSDQTTAIDYASADKMGAVTGTFLQMFDRQPHVNGVKYWTDVLENKDVSLGQMALFFMDSAEQREKIGFDITKADVPTQVEQFYESFLGRPSHTVGKEFWGKHLSEGTLSLVDLATEIIISPEMQSHYEQPEGWDYFI